MFARHETWRTCKNVTGNNGTVLMHKMDDWSWHLRAGPKERTSVLKERLTLRQRNILKYAICPLSTFSQGQKTHSTFRWCWLYQDTCRAKTIEPKRSSVQNIFPIATNWLPFRYQKFCLQDVSITISHACVIKLSLFFMANQKGVEKHIERLWEKCFNPR